MRHIETSSSHTSRRTVALSLALAALSACSMELRKKDDDDHKGPSDTVVLPIPSSDDGWTSGGDHTSCGICAPVRVFVQYGLTEDLGDNRTLTVEAFGNNAFQGAPAATVEIADFDASPGEWRETELKLGAGQFFVRAYLTTEADRRAPYPMGGMEPVESAPMGVYGAASGPQAVTVAADGEVDPVLVSLNRLYHREGSDPETNAKFRLQLALADGQVAPENKRVRIELRTTSNLDEVPKYTFEMSSDTLRVEGRPGQAEFVSPNLNEGQYVVFAFIDGDGDGYYDPDELAAMSMENGQPKALDIRKDFTRTLALVLAVLP